MNELGFNFQQQLGHMEVGPGVKVSSKRLEKGGGLSWSLEW